MDLGSLSQWFSQMLPAQAQAQAKRPSMESLITGQSAPDNLAKPSDASQSGFSQALARASEAITAPQAASEQVINQFSRGAEGEVHQSMMALEKGDISFKFLMTAKNKLVEAYKEIARMG